MKFSVIVPVFNAENWLNDCILSVQNQAYRDWELILVNDGSTDRSDAIIQAAAASDPRIVSLQQDNQGQLLARRRGILAATGEWLLFLDSDDLLAANCMISLKREIDAHDPDMILFCCRCILENGSFGDRRGYLGTEPMELDPKLLQKTLLRSDKLNSLCFKAFKRALFEQDNTDYRLYDSPMFGEDKLQLLHPATMARAIRYLPLELYQYRLHADSFVHSFRMDRITPMLRRELFRSLEQYAARWKLDDHDTMASLQAYYWKNLLSVYYGLRRPCRSREERNMLRSYPWRAALRQTLGFPFFSRFLSFRDRAKLLLIYFRV